MISLLHIILARQTKQLVVWLLLHPPIRYHLDRAALTAGQLVGELLWTHTTTVGRYVHTMPRTTCYSQQLCRFENGREMG